jgi:hypothetical protein
MHSGQKRLHEASEQRRTAVVNCGGTSGDESLRAEVDLCANAAKGGKPGGGTDGVANGPIAAASAHEIVADPIGPFGGSNWTGLLTSCE